MRGAMVYAETELEVHAVYAQGNERQAQLDRALSLLSTAKDEKRAMENKLADYESDLAAKLRGENPEMPVTAFERLVKDTIKSDPTWRQFRDDITAKIGEIEGLEFDKSFLSKHVDLAVARMTQLGGYLKFLAAAKESEAIIKASKTS